MLRVSKHTDYAVRVVLHLAALPPAERRVTAAEIARGRLIPRALVRRVVSRLSSARILTTSRGNRGGVALARDPRQISLLDVVEAMEGKVALVACADRPGACPFLESCPVSKSWKDVGRSLERALLRVRFSDLSRKLSGRRRRRRRNKPDEG